MLNLYTKVNNRSNSIVNRHLQETISNSFEHFEETVRGKRRAYWDTGLEIKVEELFRVVWGMILKKSLRNFKIIFSCEWYGAQITVLLLYFFIWEDGYLVTQS